MRGGADAEQASAAQDANKGGELMERIVDVVDHGCEVGAPHRFSFGEMRDVIVRCPDCLHSWYDADARIVCERFSEFPHYVCRDGFCGWAERGV